MTQAKWKHVTGLSTSVIVLLGTAEVVMMISPFAGFFYSAFRPALNFIAEQRRMLETHLGRPLGDVPDPYGCCDS